MPFKDSNTVILMKKGHQHDVQEEEVNKIQGFSEKNPASWTCLSDPGQSDQIYVNKS
jgi:hypothetical protein